MKAKLQFEWNLIVLVTTALVLLGLVMVYSATSASAVLGHDNPQGYVGRQALFAVIGLVGLLVLVRLDLEKLRALAPTFLGAALVLCIGVLAIGTRVNGARRWVDVGPLAFQPSEFAKLALVIWVAAYLSRRPAPRTLKALAKPVGMVALLFAALVLFEPDLGTALVIMLVVGAILLVSGTRMSLLATAYGLVIALAGIAAWSSPYRRDRLLTFLDPWKDPTGAGLQNVQALISLGSGGIFGTGPGSGTSTLRYLPEAPTDMMAAVIGGQFGLVGMTLMLLAFCAFAYAGIRLALACKDPFAKRLAAGITAIVCGQAAINIAAVVGAAPLTGIPLPFLSYGGSSLIVMLGAVGVLLNIARNGGRAAAAVPDRGRGDGRTRRAGTRSRGSAPAPRRARDVRRLA
ncbi:MAG: cell division protein FtsW [Gaiellaceae bacterium]|jgi:cell division protein FtsW|nr:cell division protein FtsW [Gaiellaceae bacterium]